MFRETSARQGYGENGAFARFAVYLDLTSKDFYIVLDNIKTQTDAAVVSGL
jgi:hypothetical protein